MGRPPTPPPGFPPPDPRQRIPQQQPWHGPPIPQKLPGPSVGTHIKRLFDWNVAAVVVTPRERQRLNQAGVVEPSLGGLLVWRRSTLLMILPVLLLSLVLAFVDSARTAGDADLERFLTPLGELSIWVPVLAALPVPVGVAVVLARWTEVARPSRILVLCWLTSIAISLLPGLVPLKWIVDFPELRQWSDENGFTSDDYAVVLAGLRSSFVLDFAIQTLPVMVATSGGVLKGAARIKSMFPAAILPGWFLLIIAPFYSLILVSVFAVIQQELGNGLLTLGVILLAAAPLVYIVFHKRYTKPMSSAEAAHELGRLSYFGGVLTWTGILFIIVFLATGNVDGTDVLGTPKAVDNQDALISYITAARTGVEIYARSVVTSVVMCLVFLNMVYREWRAFTKIDTETKREHDAEMQVFRRFDDSSHTLIHPVMRPRPPDQPPAAPGF